MANSKRVHLNEPGIRIKGIDVRLQQECKVKNIDYQSRVNETGT